jgi:hypothetical protein
MGAAALPARAGQGRPDRGDEAVVGIGGHQAHAGQTPRGQVPEERQPARAVLGRGDLQPEDLPVPVSVDPRRHERVHAHHTSALTDLQHERVHAHHTSALTDLQHERVGRDEGVWAGVERARPEVRDLGVELGGHHRDLRLGQPGDT